MKEEPVDLDSLRVPRFSVGSGEYTVTGTVGDVPYIYSSLVKYATFHDDFGLREGNGTPLIIEVERASSQWPEMLISQRFGPGPIGGFHPGAFLIPETHRLFVGAGTRILAYDLRGLRRLWEDEADEGFWYWKRHGDHVVMSAELELAAWTVEGRKLWSTFVEPPWGYHVQGTRLHLDVMGEKSDFDLSEGPDAGRAR